MLEKTSQLKHYQLARLIEIDWSCCQPLYRWQAVEMGSAYARIDVFGEACSSEECCGDHSEHWRSWCKWEYHRNEEGGVEGGENPIRGEGVLLY